MVDKTALVLGTFDGVHIGHRQVLSLSQGCDRVVALTFSVPPAMLLGKKRGLLLTAKQKERMLGSLGVEVDTLNFDAVRHTPPQEFLEQIKQKYSPARICCGFNYRFGESGSGDTAILSEFCEANGIELCIAPPVELDGVRVCSSLIREKIREGDIKTANRLLGRPFSVAGEVVHGDSRGRTMGFPTVNFYYPQDIVEPRHGVYAARCNIAGRDYPAITYIGDRPTYRLDRCIVETNILDFSGDLYGEEFGIELIGFLRDDRKFESRSELQAQIQKDIEKSTLL